MTKYTGQAFAVVRKVLRETFLPCLFFEKLKTLPPAVGILIVLTVKKYGLVLQNLVTSAANKSMSLLCERYELVGVVTGKR